VSSSSPPPAEGVRVDWEDLPPDVRAALEQRLGARVVEASTQPAGFSPGLAARLLLADGRRAFLKAVSEGANPDAPDMHRREARIVAALPTSAPVPRLLWTFDQGGWVALCFEDIDGRHPHQPWTESDLQLVVRALKALSAALTPSPIEVEATAADAFSGEINGWAKAFERGDDRLDDWCRRNLERLAALEAEAPDLVGGDTLLHFDARADNLLIAGDRVYVVDWPWARMGAAWVDWLAMAPSVTMQGGPEPEEFMAMFDLRGAPVHAMNAALCSMTGYFVVRALDPPPPGIPTLRAFQAAQGRVAIGWLRERTGWD
jgi:aminoglycoside phosphotransferase (APT) family kinase protein